MLSVDMAQTVNTQRLIDENQLSISQIKIQDGTAANVNGEQLLPYGSSYEASCVSRHL